MMFEATTQFKLFIKFTITFVLMMMAPAMSYGEGRYAAIPKQIIYPGEVIQPAMIKMVLVTNPNIRANYASSLAEVSGMVTKRTLLPGRIIPVSSVREAFIVERGQAVQLVYIQGALTITATGTPLEPGIIGDLIRVRNTDTGKILSGTAMADGTVRVLAR